MFVNTYMWQERQLVLVMRISVLPYICMHLLALQLAAVNANYAHMLDATPLPQCANQTKESVSQIGEAKRYPQLLEQHNHKS